MSQLAAISTAGVAPETSVSRNHQMANEAFVQEQVVGLSSRFVCVLVDADREPAVCRQFQVRGCPPSSFSHLRACRLTASWARSPGTCW